MKGCVWLTEDVRDIASICSSSPQRDFWSSCQSDQSNACCLGQDRRRQMNHSCSDSSLTSRFSWTSAGGSWKRTVNVRHAIFVFVDILPLTQCRVACRTGEAFGTRYHVLRLEQHAWVYLCPALFLGSTLNSVQEMSHFCHRHNSLDPSVVEIRTGFRA